MTDEQALLTQCEVYEPTSTAMRSDGVRVRVDPTTCANCGGNGQTGPSCWCPVYGEVEDDDE